MSNSSRCVQLLKHTHREGGREEEEEEEQDHSELCLQARRDPTGESLSTDCNEQSLQALDPRRWAQLPSSSFHLCLELWPNEFCGWRDHLGLMAFGSENESSSDDMQACLLMLGLQKVRFWGMSRLYFGLLFNGFHHFEPSVLFLLAGLAIIYLIFCALLDFLCCFFQWVSPFWSFEGWECGIDRRRRLWRRKSSEKSQERQKAQDKCPQSRFCNFILYESWMKIMKVDRNRES